MKSLRLRLGASLLVLLLALWYALPNIPAVGNSFLGPYMPQARINLGLDLKGGMNLTLGVDMEKAILNTLSSYGQSLRSSAADQQLTILKPKPLDSGELEVLLPRADQEAAFRELLSKDFPSLEMVSVENAPSGGLRFLLTLSPSARAYTEELTMDQVVRTIRNRIDQFGVAEPDIRKQADNRVQVQLPGLTDPERAIQIVGQTAHLEFHLVRDDIDPNSLMLPPGTAFFPMQEKGMEESRIILDKEALMTGEDITDARPAFDEKGQAYVSLEFNSRGAKQFEQISGENVKKRMAIVLDGVVYSAPVIQQKISGGRASISGRFTTTEAQDLSVVLRAGSLPAPVSILEERTVGPSLGHESITSGINAALIGALAVVIVMLVYYGLSGVIADVMLCFTMTLVVAGMAAFGATLTLPGIAGIVLTIGMAVDANVLIYERIREELRKGASNMEAVDAGFDRASISIVDSNLTTIIAALILYQFGTGPIRGFAVTLTLGILASMFSAIFVSKAFFQFWMQKTDGKGLRV